MRFVMKALGLNLSFVATAAALVMSVGLSACSDGQAQKAAPGAAGGQMPPPEVAVVTVQTQAVPMVSELPGRLEASRVAQVRARVPGVVQQRLFTEGSDVKAGQPLFKIDASSYEAALQSAQAAQAKAEANLSQASALLERYQPLQAAKAISPQEFLTAQVAQRQAQADVATAKAAVKTAQINLSYANITSPISGRIGRSLVTEGALVGQGEVTQLATVQQVNPLYLNFTQPANEALALKRALAAGSLKKNGNAAEVRVVLDDGSEYALPGKLLFSDLSVDPTSGQVNLRAEIPNPQGALLPGLYVRVRLAQAEVDGGLMLPQQAVTRGATGDVAMVVDAQGMVTPRPVKLGGALGNQWVVLSGLKAGEQVMVEGFQKLKPKSPVKTVPWVPKVGVTAAAPAAPVPASAASAAR
jgi:membrane fusion protein (multidrug efflux system)